jgi:hypothetical protein
MKPWEMLWNVVTGKGEQPAPAETPVQPASAKLDYLDRLKMAESGGRADVKAATSSATGHHQFVDSTWKSLTQKYKLNYSLEDRKDPVKSREVAALFTDENRQILSKTLGKEPTDAQLYSAHFLGTTGAKKFLSAKPFELATKVVSKDQVAANKSIFFDKETKKPHTVAEVYRILQKKIGEE